MRVCVCVSPGPVSGLFSLHETAAEDLPPSLPVPRGERRSRCQQGLSLQVERKYTHTQNPVSVLLFLIPTFDLLKKKERRSYVIVCTGDIVCVCVF